MNVVKQVLRAVQLPTSDALKFAEAIIKMIRNDAKEGIMQDGSQNHKYSRQYAKYKANSMRRFTSDVTKKDWEDKFNGVGSNFYRLPSGKVVIKASRLTKKGKQIKNKRVGNYYAKSLDTETAFVNMKLTGDTLKGLKATDRTQATATGMFIQVAYDAKDSGKIIGNAKHGYYIDRLRKKNVDDLAKNIHEKIIERAKQRLE